MHFLKDNFYINLIINFPSAYTYIEILMFSPKFIELQIRNKCWPFVTCYCTTYLYCTIPYFCKRVFGNFTVVRMTDVVSVICYPWNVCPALCNCSEGSVSWMFKSEKCLSKQTIKGISNASDDNLEEPYQNMK